MTTQEIIAIHLVDFRGGIHTQVYAEILPDGALQVEGYDAGDLPKSEAWDDDVEYGIVVPPEEKAKVMAVLLEALKDEERTFPQDPGKNQDENLLSLLAFVYQGRLSTFDEFKNLVEKKNIKHSFWWW